MALSAYFNKIRSEVEGALDRLVPKIGAYPPVIHESMRYSLFAGGKRLRPMLALAACDCVGGERKSALAFACAIEIIHTYTLIHDDLPAIDNDDMRRGKPTNHKKFGEATAILAGDGLLTLAFEIMTGSPQADGASAQTLLEVTAQTARAAGSTGTAGGQVADIASEGCEPDGALLEYIHSHKTGKLITASVRGGAMIGGAHDDQLRALTDYGKHIGLAFQIVDDILDIEGDEKKLGKNLRSDIKKEKMTYPSVAGMEESKKRAVELSGIAVESLEMFGSSARHLKDLAMYITTRTF